MKKLITILFAFALGLNLSAQTDYVESWDPDADGDGLIGVSDLLALLGVFQEEDMDNDGIWDSQDDCVGVYDECGVCNGEGPPFQVIDSIIVNYDSVFVDVLGEWLVFELSTDTVYSFQCSWECEMPWEFDSYEYSTVQIGDQCWFAENLRTEHYTNGDAIPANISDDEWWLATSGALTVFGEDTGCDQNSPDGDACDPAWSLNEYGRLYNWFAVDDERGLCPIGWHVPTDGEWTVLTDYLGGESVAGVEMKTTYGWNGGGNGTNSSGFSGLPGGTRIASYPGAGHFGAAGAYGIWWSSSLREDNIFSAYNRTIVYTTQDFYRSWDNRATGFSVRCVRD